MDLKNILIGCVKRVASKAEALSVFKNTIGIAGVVWNAPIELPTLTDEQQELLSKSHVTWSAKGGCVLVQDNEWSETILAKGMDDVLKPYFDMAVNDIALAHEFKGDVPNRKHHFLQDDDLDVGAHFDAKARNLWIHRHILGNGLRVYFPTDGKAIEVVAGPQATNIIPSFRMQEFAEKGWITSFELQANDIIVFNQNLLHASNSGQRFRSAVNGYYQREI